MFEGKFSRERVCVYERETLYADASNYEHTRVAEARSVTYPHDNLRACEYQALHSYPCEHEHIRNHAGYNKKALRLHMRFSL
jgi:hypothetical protein